jgi:alpha-amylase/alpha-mannosidase (GH57 family)
MQRFVCIHGHFYQPPRENPWTHHVEREPSAAPFHDWNERIASECYGPNSASPVLDDHGRIVEVTNNYARISYDFGPTLLRWLESHYSELYDRILEADRESIRIFSGHGSAIAQVYNHMIMPLASPADRRTQTRWGAEDFERRYGRYPEGMWLPETAVDTDTLEALAAADIRFTILSPRQAAGVRKKGEERWTDVSGGRIDTRQAYIIGLPSGRSISVFFYDDGISNRIAFGDLLSSGSNLSKALLDGFSSREGPQLVNVASDGETYGHHHRNGHIVLARSLSEVERSGNSALVNYALFLTLAPPEQEVRLLEPTSWSCFHGVERWRSNCGCGSEIRPGYNQEWRLPLRSSLDWLRDRLDEVYSKEGSILFVDKDAAKNGFGSSGIGKGEMAEDYLEGQLKKSLPWSGKRKARKLREMLECSALMYASCAWFWEDITRPETRQVLRFAARAMEIAEEVSGTDLEPRFSQILGGAVPNDPAFRPGPALFSELIGGKTGR